jgi:hypothetical protein
LPFGKTPTSKRSEVGDMIKLLREQSTQNPEFPDYQDQEEIENA